MQASSMSRKHIVLSKMFEPLPVLRDSKETTDRFVASLIEASERKDAGKARVLKWTVETSTGPVEVDSWKFKEFEYSRSNIQLPCRARGLFMQGSRILARGYDKFFNQEEVPETKMEALKKLEGPFNVSTKENGCIIFISGLEDGTLLVCSKHSTGERDGEKSKHFIRGHQETLSQLERIGKRPEDLARILFEFNLTAVAELCDDDFEEHVVEYPKELAGLYLHGLNYNTQKFHTYPMDLVSAFAEEWGFRKVSDFTFDSFDRLWAFLEKTGETGTFNGREIEGFVIRAKKDGLDYFFKYKLKEPYFLYRQLREATLDLINPEAPQKIPQIVHRRPAHKKITFSYLEYVEKLFEENPQLKEDYLNSLGIIKVRKMYLKHMGFGELDGLGLVRIEDKDEKLSQKLDKLLKATTFHYGIVPIASIGCGKTTTIKTLTNLIPEWGHVQSDDFYKRKLKFTETCLLELGTHKVVFIDKNHQQARIRKEHFSSFHANEGKFVPPNILVKYVGINFMSKGTSAEHWKFLEKRLIARGDNHQTLRVKKEGDSASKKAKGFYDSFSPPELKVKLENESLPVVVEGNKYEDPDSNFHIIINLDCTQENSSLENAKIILRELTKAFPEIQVPNFTESQWMEAFESAKNHEVKVVAPPPAPKAGKAIYVGIEITPSAIQSIADNCLREDPTWNGLVEAKRVQQDFHVTVAHCMAARDAKKKASWAKIAKKFDLKANGKVAKETGRFPLRFFADLNIKSIVVVEQTLITLRVELSAIYTQNELSFILDEDKIEPTNTILHITVGTMSEKIRPAMSNTYLEKLVASHENVTKGEYILDDKKFKVWDVDVSLEKQQLFVYYQFD